MAAVAEAQLLRVMAAAAAVAPSLTTNTPMDQAAVVVVEQLYLRSIPQPPP
jgi:hypothetical protein